MTMMIIMTTIIMIISNIMMFLSIILAKKKKSDKEKYSPFECGFSPHTSARIPFSMHFFLITVIFLIFDVEIALIFPMISTFQITSMFNWTLTSTFFILVLIIGIYHEWNQSMLEWTN